MYTSPMTDLHLDLRDRARVVDFLADALEYASAKERADAEKWITAYQDGERVPTDKLAAAARRLAQATWPARYALGRYAAKEGAEDEWKKVLAAIRPSTAHLLKRFRTAAGVATLDEALAHGDADAALRSEERVEIDEVRRLVRQDMWRRHGKSLAVLVKSGQAELKGAMDRIQRLRDLASDLPRGLQDEAFSKIVHYEDRILFGGEIVPLEILDQEIAYYTEQKEINPLEPEGRFTGRRKRPPEI